jgi:CRISPR/Cas system-associated exonuclease Cas4 (RecB family)
MSIKDIRKQAAQCGVITRHLESWRLAHEKANGRKPDGFWHPSSISGCPTAAVYEYLGFHVPGAPFDARLLRIFDTGHAVHEMLQSQFTKAGIVAQVAWPGTRVLSAGVEVPIVDEAHKLCGTLDVIFDIKGLRFVGEIKTKHSSSFAKMTDAQEDHKLQATCYHWKALDYGWINTDYAVVLYFSKDDSHIAEYKVPMNEERIKTVKNKLDVMNNMVNEWKARRKAPDPYYTEVSKPPCRTCKWAQGCFSTLTRESWIASMTEKTNEPASTTAQKARKPPTRIKAS